MFTKHRWVGIFVIFMLLVPHGQSGAHTSECNDGDSLKIQASQPHSPSEKNLMPHQHKQHLETNCKHCVSQCEMCDPDQCSCCEGLYTGFHFFALSPIDNDIWFEKAFSFSSITIEAQSLASGFSAPPFHPPISC